MSGLFKTLFNLVSKQSSQPLEDYLTEIFAFLISENKSVLVKFLEKANIYGANEDEFTITTQYELRALESQDVDSRPDIAIFGDDIAVLIENKVHSGEGYMQLSRYAEHLDCLHQKQKKLIYITKDFDPKDEESIFLNCTTVNKNDFIQLRWYQIAQTLKSFREDVIASELLTFMKQNRLTMNNQFTPLDLITMTNFSNISETMDEIILGEISSKFEKVTGNITQKSTRLTQLKESDRYIYYSKQVDSIHILLGFWMNSKTDEEYPSLGVEFEINPNNDNIKHWEEVFRKIENNFSGWKTHFFNNPRKWSIVERKTSLQSILSTENHVLESKAFLLDCIADLESIFKEFGFRD